MPFELRPLRHLVTLVELGSFARAAVALQLTQPALTRSIQALERKIGTELVLRSSSGITPTDVGRLLVQRARELLQLADDIDRDVLGRSTLQSGHVAVGAGPYPAETIFVVALQRFVEAYPMVKVRLQIRAWDELLARLRSREIDFFVAEISTLQREADVDIEPMTEHPLYFAVRPGHPLTRRDANAVEQVLAYPVVAMSRLPPRILQPMLAAHRRATRSRTTNPPFPAVENATLASLKRMVSGSDMIAAIPLPCIRDELDDGTLVVLASVEWLHLKYGLVRLKSHPMSPAARRLRELVLEAERTVTAEEQALMEQWTGADKPASRRKRDR
jgi:DNA-binding transcriptional LysR family regulator